MENKLHIFSDDRFGSIRTIELDGKPHAQAVGAIIEKLQPLNADEWTKTPYSRNGHDGESIQYTQSVEDKVKNWLVENQYPTIISNQSKNFTVKYLS